MGDFAPALDQETSRQQHLGSMAQRHLVVEIATRRRASPPPSAALLDSDGRTRRTTPPMSATSTRRSTPPSSGIGSEPDWPQTPPTARRIAGTRSPVFSAASSFPALPHSSFFSGSLASRQLLSPNSSASLIKRSFAKHIIFQDVDTMKRNIRETLTARTYRVEDFYHSTGLWQRIARSIWFEYLTLAVVVANLIWLGVEIDLYYEDVIVTAQPTFFAVENFFCIYFSLELYVRAAAFQKILEAIKNVFFLVDALLVATMVVDTWLFSFMYLYMGKDKAFANAPLKIVRLLRLLRIARMFRVFRAFPDLMILIKGMAAAARSVAFTLSLLIVALYVFALAFRQLTIGSEVGDEVFYSIGATMYALLVSGVFLDSIGSLLDQLRSVNLACVAVFLVFVFLAAFTLMNLLIGVLCEVVTAVSRIEKETMAVAFMKSKLQLKVEEVTGPEGVITRELFLQLLGSDEVIRALTEVGVDLESLLDLTDVIFDTHDEHGCVVEKHLCFADFMGIVLDFRGSNASTVKDILNLQKYVRRVNEETTAKLEMRMTALDEKINDLLKHFHIPLQPKTQRVTSSSSNSRVVARNANPLCLAGLGVDTTGHRSSPPMPTLTEGSSENILDSPRLACGKLEGIDMPTQRKTFARRTMVQPLDLESLSQGSGEQKHTGTPGRPSHSTPSNENRSPAHVDVTQSLAGQSNREPHIDNLNVGAITPMASFIVI